MQNKLFPYLFILVSIVVGTFFASCTSSDNSFSNNESRLFRFEGKTARIVYPAKAAEGRPWVWRARFWAHEPQTDQAMLDAGFHIVYVDVGGLYGSLSAVKIWDHFYDYLTDEMMLSKHPVLEGMSRGGLIIFNWALAHPEIPAAIYGDNPVCDIKSWPAGRGDGAGHLPSWEECLDVYHLTDTEATDYKQNPVDRASALAEAGIPLILVCGDSDSVVPFDENGRILFEAYNKVKAPVQLILKPGADHHPHSLENPQPIVDFLLKWNEFANNRHFESE